MRLLPLLLGTGLLVVLVWGSVPVASDAAPSMKGLGDVRSRIDRAGRGLARKDARARVLTADIDRYDARIDAAQRRIDAIQGRLSALTTTQAREQAELGRVRRDLRGQRARVLRLRVRLAQGRDLLARRLVELYQAPRADLVTVVLNAKGFEELLERGEFLTRIAASDRSIVTEVKRARQAAGASVRRLAVTQRRQAALVQRVRDRRAAVARAKQEVVDVRAAAARARRTKRSALRAVRASAAQIRSEVRSLRRIESRIAAQLRRAQAANAPGLPSSAAPPVRGAGGGPLIWPVTGPITSPFCERRSYEACHPGLDIAAPEGTPLRAVADGTVVLLQGVAASGGYGNYTCIQHTASMSSCYAHQQRFGTTLGAKVKQGQIIGYVGNTGRSFGSHVHWEVRINGAVTNPLSYV